MANIIVIMGSWARVPTNADAIWIILKHYNLSSHYFASSTGVYKSI